MRPKARECKCERLEARVGCVGRKNTTFYPGKLENIYKVGSQNYQMMDLRLCSANNQMIVVLHFPFIFDGLV